MQIARLSSPSRQPSWGKIIAKSISSSTNPVCRTIHTSVPAIS